MTALKVTPAHWARILDVALIVSAVGLLYGQTLNVPFYLDDQWAIVEKYLLRDLPATVGQLLSQRGLTNLTFALNYRLTEWALPPLHLVNIALHAGCGVLVWLLLRRFFGDGRWLPLLGALLFVAHPLQTQAVTYLVQRATLLGGFFFLLAVLCYLRARQALAAGATRGSAVYLRPYLGAVAAGACAVLSKENTATLPLVLLALERLLPVPERPSWRRTLLDCLPFCVAPLLVGLLTFSEVVAAGGSPVLHSSLASLQHNSPLNYLVTEFSVIWVYLRLFVWPCGQALEHGYPVVAELFDLQNLLALTGLLVLWWGVWRSRRRYPLIAFGVVWFFLALAVESSVIPLDPLFEHRLYLPMLGLVLVVLGWLSVLMGKKPGLVAPLGVLMLMACIPLTWRRNALWSDPIALYEDNLRRLPYSERAGEALATLYADVGRFDEENRLLVRMRQIFPQNQVMLANLAKSYAERNRVQEALALLEEGMQRQPQIADYYETAAAIASFHKEHARAVAYLEQGLLVPGIARERLLNDLGVIYSEAGDAVSAERAFRESLAVKPDNAISWLNLGKEYYARQRWQEALTVLLRAQDLAPGNPETIEGLVRSALLGGNMEVARWAMGKLQYADPQAWRRLRGDFVGQTPPTRQ